VHRNLAIVPKSRDLSTAPVLRLKIPQTSDFDGLNKEAQPGMFAFTNYLNFLKSKQVPFTYSLTTKMRFDNTSRTLCGSPGRWLTGMEMRGARRSPRRVISTTCSKPTSLVLAAHARRASRRTRRKLTTKKNLS
jgi:hypothetical protein